MQHARTVSFATLGVLVLALWAMVPGAAAQVPVDPSGAVQVEGTVVSLEAGPGMGGALLTLDENSLGRIQVVLGPYWFLQGAGFAPAPGATVRGTLYPCSTCPAPWVAAVLEDPDAGVTVTFRDASGFPAWRGGPGHRGRAGRWGGAAGPRGSRGACLAGGAAVGTLQTVTGTVKSVDVATGTRATLVLDTAEGPLELVVAPWRALLAAGVSPAPGDTVEVQWATLTTRRGTFAAVFSLTDPSTGKTVQLRDPATGMPAGVGAGGGRWGGTS